MSCEYQRLIDYVNGVTDFNSHNDMKLTVLRENYAECRADLTKDSFNLQGFVHGGLLFAVCDVAAGYSITGDSRRCVTSGANFSFLREVHPDQKFIRAVGEPIRIGTRTAVVEGKVYDESDRLVAKGIFNYVFTDC